MRGEVGRRLMENAARFISATARRARGVKVIALVGKSGSGKSFRARLVAEKRGIEVIVDDGLIIHGQSIVAGHWAKKEQSLLAAVRRALFVEPSHARAAREALRRIRFRRVLIVATSTRMAALISRSLQLPSPMETIAIEDVATRQEIEASFRRRSRAGAHASPIPEIRIRRGLLSAVVSALRRTEAGGRQDSLIVTPSGGRGWVRLSEAAFGQMALHCVKEFDPGIDVLRVSLLKVGGMAVLELSVRIPAGLGRSGRLHELKEAVAHGMEQGTGIMVREVRLVVEEISLPRAAAARAARGVGGGDRDAARR